MDGNPIGVGNFEGLLDDERVGCAAVVGLGYETDERRPTTVTLLRAVDDNQALWSWAVRPEPRTLTITLLDVSWEPVCSYVLRGARPVRWVGPAFDAMSGEVAMEGLEIDAEGIGVRRDVRA